MKRTALKRSKKKSTQEQIAQAIAMLDMFKEIWDERLHSCYETGEGLGEEPKTIYFHHVLPKLKYPQYAISKWNIVLLSWLAHDQCEIDLDRSPKVKALYLDLLEKHHNFELKP